MDDNTRIEVLVTGGTFDKDYNMITGELWFNNTNVPSMFTRGRCTLDVDIQQLMMVDSLEMSEKQRQQIIEKCRTTNRKRIVITHGTDRIVMTATALAHANIKNKTIVLTGAMIPYKFGSSDGFFNLGSAVAFAQTLPAGVYVVMNGRYYSWDNVRKNYDTGYFEEITNLKVAVETV